MARERQGLEIDLMDRAILFDLDGTLTDPRVGITESIRFALARLSAEVPPAEELLWCIGPPLVESFETLLGDDRVGLAVRYYRERFSSVGLYENAPYPGIHDALRTLQARGIRLYVASSKPEIYVRQILEYFQLFDFFDDVFGSELDGTRTNKSDLLHFAIEKTGIDPSDATMVGDRKHDIIGALDNGISPVGVLYGYGSLAELKEAGANRLANTTSELVSLLL